MIKSNNVVLVVDDEIRIRRFLRAGFELHGGFAIMEAETAQDGLAAAVTHSPDIVILDLTLPDFDGGEFLARLRGWSSVPVIVLSANSSESEKVRLLEMGADDYIVKPFGMPEFLARCSASLRRYYRTPTTSPVVHAGRLTVDLASRDVLLDGNKIFLTRKQFSLIGLLARHLGNVVTHDTLLGAIWPNKPKKQIQYLRILVRSVRKRIEIDYNDPRLLVTQSGIGYMLKQHEPVSRSQ